MPIRLAKAGGFGTPDTYRFPAPSVDRWAQLPCGTITEAPADPPLIVTPDGEPFVGAIVEVSPAVVSIVGEEIKLVEK